MTLSSGDLALLAWHGPFDPCDTCGQTVNHRCRTASGNLTTPHKSRLDWARGYDARQGEVDGLATQVSSLKAANEQLDTTLKTADDQLDVATQRLSEAQTALAGRDVIIAQLNAKIAELTKPPTPSTLFGFWPGGSAATPKDEDGDKDVDWFDDWTRVVRYLGRPQILRNFPPGGIPASFAGTRPQVLGIKAFVESYTKVALADWLSGKAGDLLATYLDSVPAEVHVYFDPHHEPYPEWTTADIVKVWTKVLTQVPKKPNLHPTSIPMGYDLTAKRYSEDTLVDGIEVLAPDLYLTHGTLADTFEPMHNVAVKYGLKFGVSECAKAQTFLLPGMNDDQTSVALVRYLRDTVAAKWGAEYITLFESNKSDGNWLLQDDTDAVKAWVAAR